METMNRIPVIESTNELPLMYRTWLEFYDDIAPELLAEPVLQVKVEEPRALHNYRIERDFYLARIAEALLPMRPTRGQVNAALMEVNQSRDISTSGAAMPLLNKLREVARRS